jgi:hypothetical protein
MAIHGIMAVHSSAAQVLAICSINDSINIKSGNY